MREQHLSCVNDCRHVPLTLHLVPQASNSVSSSPLKLKYPKYPVPSPNQGHNATTILLRSRHPLLLHEKLEPPHPLASVFQLHTPTVSEVFFSQRETYQIPNPSCSRMHTRTFSFPKLKLLLSPFKPFSTAKSSLLIFLTILPLTFSLFSLHISLLLPF